MQKTIIKKNRRSGKWLLIALVILALALLIAYFGRFSLGNGNNTETGATPSEKTEENTKTAESGENTAIKISIKGEKIFWQEEEISLDSLSSKLNESEKGKVTFHLIDDGATLGTYEEVEKALAASGHTFTKVDNIKK